MKRTLLLALILITSTVYSLPRDEWKWLSFRNFIGGIHDSTNSFEIKDNEWRDAENFDFYNLSITGRKGYDVLFKRPISSMKKPVTSVGKFYRADGLENLIITSEDTYYIISTANDTVTVLTTGRSNVQVDFETINDQFYMVNGVDSNLVWNGDTLQTVGISRPTKIADTYTVQSVGGGNIENGTYKYVVTFYNTVTGYEGNAKSITQESDEFEVIVDTGLTNTITLIGIDTQPNDPKVNARRVYRTKANGSIYFLAGTILGTDTDTFYDNTDDFSLIDILSTRNGVPPRSYYIESINGITYYVDVDRTTVHFSELNLPESVDALSNFKVNKDDGDIITGIKAQDDLLLITKRNSVHAFFNPSPTPITKGILRQVSKEVGCANNKAIVSFQNAFIFAEEDGIYQYRNNFVAEGIGNAAISKISFKIDENIKGLDFDNSSGVYHNNQIYFTCSKDNSTFNDVILVFNTKYQYWTKYTGIDASELLVLNGGADDNQLIFASGRSTFVGTMDITTTDGTFKNITDTFTYDTLVIDFDSSHLQNFITTNDTDLDTNAFLGSKVFIFSGTQVQENNVVIGNDTYRIFFLDTVTVTIDTNTSIKIGSIKKSLKSKFYALTPEFYEKRARKFWMDYEVDIEDFNINFFLDNDQFGGTFLTSTDITSSAWDLGNWFSDTVPNDPAVLIWDFGNVQRTKSDFPKFSNFNRISFGFEDNSANDLVIRNYMLQYKVERER